MMTPRERAEALVKIRREGEVFDVMLDYHITDVWDNRDEAEEDADNLRAVLTATLEAHECDLYAFALAEPPVSAKQEKEIRERHGYSVRVYPDLTTGERHIRDLLALLDHARAQLAFAVREESHHETYRRGVAEGLRLAKEAHP